MKTLKLILLATLVGGIVNAQESQSTATTSNTSSAKVSDLQKSEEKEKDIDDEITNARMRAELGSKSKWSFKSALAYNGGSVKKPTSEVRPEYRGTEGAPTPTDLSGTVGVNYRLTERDSLSVGTGVAVVTPFHGDYTRSRLADPTSSGDQIDRFQVSTPYISWSRGYKSGGLQMATEVEGTFATQSTDVRSKNIANLNLQQTLVGEFGTKVSAGAYLQAIIPFHSSNRDLAEESVYGRQRELTLGVIPFMEYSFSDTLSARTVFGWFYASKLKNKRAGEDSAALRLNTPYQSVGVGYSITRDIYLYPNVQFVPFDIRSERTNVGLTALVNVF